MKGVFLKKRLLVLIIATLTIATLFPGAVWAHNSWHSTQPFNNPNPPPPPITEPPAPVLLWQQDVEGDVTDLAVGDLNGDRNEDVAAIDNTLFATLNVLNGEGGVSENGSIAWSKDISGFSVAVGDIDGDHLNEVVAHSLRNGILGFGTDGSGNSIIAYENDGTFKWQHYTSGEVKDIEIGDVDGDGIKDVIACNNFSVPGTIYVINGVTGHDLPGWPKEFPGEEFMDVAVGQLDGISGMDIAAIGRGLSGSLIAFDKSGGELWSTSDSGRTVEIGDVNGDGFNEVVAGTDDGYVLVYKGIYGEGEDVDPLFSFQHSNPITDVELGDLDGNAADGVEVACISSDEQLPDTLYALDIDNLTSAPDSQIMWSYPISWDSQFYYGESLAIGDVDRDYKNEVIAAGQNQIELNSVGEFQFITSSSVYAFDGLDDNHDGIGDLVWSPYEVNSPITDLEIGDLDGDGDQDVVFGTLSSEEPTGPSGLTVSQFQSGSIYAITAVESKTQTATNSGTAYFDADPSTLEDLQPVSEGTLPSAGKPNFNYPHGFFSFNITGLDPDQTPGQTAIVTLTLPSNAPIGTKWVKYQNGQWFILPIGDDDGDNIITFEVTDGGIGDADGVKNGTIVEPGGPGYPKFVGGEVMPVDRLAVLTPWLVLILGLMIGGTILILSRRKES